MSENAGNAKWTVCVLVLLGATAFLPGVSTAVAGNDPEARFRGTGKADPIRIENVRRFDGPGAGQSTLTFDLAWDHSWRAAWEVSPQQHGGKGKLSLENWDAAWVFVKFHEAGANGWLHATLSTSKADHPVPAGAALDVGPSNDGRRGLGVFVYRKAPGHGANHFKGVSLSWMHGTDAVADPGAVELEVLAIRMVRVPHCAFWAGDGTTNRVAAQFSAGTGTKPFRIETEKPIILGGVYAQNLGTRDGAGQLNTDDFHSEYARTLPGEFPKGYEGFYCMRNEVTQGQYVEFLNTLRSGQQGGFSMSGQKGSRNGIKVAVPTKPAAVRAVPRRDSVVASFSTPTTPAVYTTDTPHVACAWMTWNDCAAYAAWAGLRPMTELEFEKACRGPLKPVPDEYAWGTNKIAGTNSREGPRDGYALQNPGQPDEQVVWEGSNGPDDTRGNAVWWGVVEHGKASYALHGINGPLRVGIFATPDSGRVAAGASYWGIMDLTGNVQDRLVTVATDVGRRFAGTHGDGSVAQPDGWRQSNSRGLLRTRGGSFRRGGDYGTIRTSDRSETGRGGDGRFHQWAKGFRCVRTEPQAKKQ